MSGAAAGALAALALAGLAAGLLLRRRGPRAQHAAPRGMIVVDLRPAAPPAGYDAEDTGQWLTRPRDTAAYEQLAPGRLGAAAAIPPHPRPALAPGAQPDVPVMPADVPLERPRLELLPPPAPREPQPGRRPGWRRPAAVPQPGPGAAAGQETEPEAPAAAAARPTDLPLVVYAQLGGLSVQQFVDDLFAGTEAGRDDA